MYLYLVDGVMAWHDAAVHNFAGWSWHFSQTYILLLCCVHFIYGQFLVDYFFIFSGNYYPLGSSPPSPFFRPFHLYFHLLENALTCAMPPGPPGGAMPGCPAPTPGPEPGNCPWVRYWFCIWLMLGWPTRGPTIPIYRYIFSNVHNFSETSLSRTPKTNVALWVNLCICTDLVARCSHG